WTMAGICQAGDVLGLIDGDVAVIGQEVAATASAVLDRMLAAGGEMVTLVVGDDAPDTVAAHLETRVREGYLAVDTVVYSGGRQGALLLIGVECTIHRRDPARPGAAHGSRIVGAVVCNGSRARTGRTTEEGARPRHRQGDGRAPRPAHRRRPAAPLPPPVRGARPAHPPGRPPHGRA